MSNSPFSRLRELLSIPLADRRKRSRQPGARGLAFEALERRELLSVSALSSFSVSENTGEKPQSKVWEYNDTWYSVMPDSSGTWVWELNGTDWQKDLQLSSNKNYHGDVKVDGDLAHIFLFDGSSSSLATIQYDAGPNNGYEMWSLRPSLVNVAISGSAETAVIDIDSTGRMWVAYDTSSSIEVRYADAGTQYTNWSGPITVASGIKSDDIGSLIAMPDGTLGVMWSNQNTKRFGFRLHVDGADPNTWLAAEVPASQSAQNKGNGMADDHINMAVASDGTLYAAVKTSYDSSGYPRMCLLVRRPSGRVGRFVRGRLGGHAADRDDQRSGRQADCCLHSIGQWRQDLLQGVAAPKHFVRLAPDADVRVVEQRFQRQGAICRRSGGDRGQRQQSQRGDLSV